MVNSNNMKVIKSIVPGFFTVGNMFCGFFSIISALNEQFILAAWMIFFAAFLDTMDGKIARFTGSSSQFGVEYDSLADVISFGLAPSLLIYVFYFQVFGVAGILISFLPLLFGSIRLARFNANLKGFDKSYFTGLPIPVAALGIVSFIIFSESVFDDPASVSKIIILMVVLVSVLMVSNVRYETMPQLSFRGSRENRIKFIMVFLGAVLLVIFPNEILFPLILIYIFYGLLRLVSIKTFSGDKTVESKN